MRKPDWHRNRGRLGVVLSAVVASLVFGVVAARADAPDPVLQGTQSSMVTNPDGSRTVTLWGQWVWPTHHTDCNLDKRAVGYAVDWNDPDQPGHIVTTLNHVTIAVGADAANAYNPADNLVWPTEPATASTDRNVWRGGCGSFNSTLGYNTGNWGPISHTYAAGSDTLQACVLMYDVHLATDGGAPNKDSEIVAGGSGHNGDNSAQGNSGSPLGNGCFTYTVVPWASIGLILLTVVLAGSLAAWQIMRRRRHLARAVTA